MAETILGFDYGRRRIGVAVGETLTGAARALDTLTVPRSGEIPWPRIEALVSDWRARRGVVRVPHHLDGREAPLGAAARNFAGEIERRTGATALLWNEALSTEAAREAVAGSRQAGHRRGGRDRLNAEAARAILQGWLREGR